MTSAFGGTCCGGWFGITADIVADIVGRLRGCDTTAAAAWWYCCDRDLSFPHFCPIVKSRTSVHCFDTLNKSATFDQKLCQYNIILILLANSRYVANCNYIHVLYYLTSRHPIQPNAIISLADKTYLLIREKIANFVCIQIISLHLPLQELPRGRKLFVHFLKGQTSNVNFSSRTYRLLTLSVSCHPTKKMKVSWATIITWTIKN